MSFLEHRTEWTDEQVARLWDYYARTPPFRDSYFSRVHGGRILAASRLPRNARLEVLDFGCGPGFMWEHVVKARTEWGYTGLDFSPASIAEIRAKGEGHPQFRGAHHISGLPSPLRGASFDVVLLVEVVEHLNDLHLDATLAEAARLLKPRGVAIVTAPNDEDLSSGTRLCPECGATFHQWQHVRSWTAASLAESGRRHGLSPWKVRVLDCRDVGPHRVPVVWARWIVRGPQKQPHLLAMFEKR